ncbi:MAG: nickel-binding protein [Thermoplasmata archaeon]
MPKYIDTHEMGTIDPETLKKLQHAPVDEFGVTHHDILFNQAENRVYCVLNAPNADAVRKHHAEVGLKCDWVHEVESTRT